MRRGDIVLGALPGDYGKSRPIVVVHETRLIEISESLLVAPFTSALVGGEYIRVTVEPSETNGLEKTSRIMADKLHSMPKHRIRDTIGSLTQNELVRLDEALRTILGLRLD